MAQFLRHFAEFADEPELGHEFLRKGHVVLVCEILDVQQELDKVDDDRR